MNRLCSRLALGIWCLAGVFSGAEAAEMNVLVPAYANPCCNGGVGMWQSLITAAADPSRHYELDVIFNPASGPGSGRDPNYLDAAGLGPLATFTAAGGKTFGYVATNGGARALADVKAEINAYLIGQYAGYVQGIFFDEMSNDLGKLGYYQELNAYVKTLSPGARTLGNPGTTYLTNTSGQTTFAAADYVASFDTLLSFENTGAAYQNEYANFAYLNGLAPSKIAHMLHTQATWNASLIGLAAARGAGYLYVTDDVMVNPYDTLPSYWAQFSSDVSAYNLAAVPEPSNAALMLAGMGVLAWRFRRSRASQVFGGRVRLAVLATQAGPQQA